MNIKLFKPSKILFALMLVSPLCLFNASAMAQTDEDKAQDKDIEVIGVVGERSLLYFKDQLLKAEMDFYDAYNALDIDEKFRVVCRRENRPGSRIKDDVCYPQYVLQRMAQETQEALLSGLPYPDLDDIEFAVREEREESMAYVEKVVTENPHLIEKLIVMNQKKQKYEEMKATQ